MQKNKQVIRKTTVIISTFFALALAFAPVGVRAADNEENLVASYSPSIPAKEYAEDATRANSHQTASVLASGSSGLLGMSNGVDDRSDLVNVTNANEFGIDMNVKYPEGFTLKVEVDNPENVKWIDWYLSDGDLIDIPDKNQGKYQFQMPSTNPYFKEMWIAAVITDNDNNKIFTDDVHVIVDTDDKVPVLYVVDYALTPGQSINLAEKDYGTGTIAFDVNGTDFTFTDVNMNVDESAKYMDRDISMGTNILLYYPVYSPEEYYADLPTNYNFTFIGDNQIINNLYEALTRDAIGVELNSYFHDVDNLANRPTVTLQGANPLTLHGGARSINTDGNLVLDIDLNITQVHEEAYTTAIYSTGLVVEESHTLDIASNHGVIESESDVILKDGVTLKAKTTPTHGRNQYFGYTAIAAGGDLKMSHVTLDLTGEVKAEKYPADYFLSRLPVLAAIGDLEIKDSDVAIKLTVSGESSRTFAYSFAGMRVGNQEHTLNIDNSKVQISLDTPEAENVVGISSLGTMKIANSDIDVNLSGRGQVLGISAEDLLTIKNSNVSAIVTAENSTDEDAGKEFAAIVGRPILVDQADASYRISAKINQGAAFVSADKFALPADATRPTYDASYVPSLTKLNGAKILSPVDGVLSSGTYASYYDNEYLAETVYSLTNTATPALDVTIAGTSTRTNDRHGWGDNSASNAKASEASPDNSTKKTCAAATPVGIADLFQIERKGSDATIYFTPVSDYTDRYHVIFGNSEGDERYSGVAMQVSREQNSGVLAIDVHNLDPSAQYSFKVAPVNDCAVGEWSNWLTAKGVSRYGSNKVKTYRYN